MTLIDEIQSTLPDRRRDRIRGTILDAAESVYTDEGEAGLSIRGIAEALDYSVSAIYKYFRTKRELVDALKESFFARIIEQIADHRDSEKPYHERARNCVAVYIHTALERPGLYAAAFSGVDTEVSATCHDEFMQSNKGRAFDYLRSIVEQGVEIGELRRDLDPSLAAKSLWASCHGMAMLGMHLPGYPSVFPDGDDLNQKEFIDYHADLILRGLESTHAPHGETAVSSGPRVRVL